MPYATNPLDGVRTYFEDGVGNAPAVLFYTGFADPLQVAKASRLTRSLRGEFRVIIADHRGQGASDKPRSADSYALTTRVADAVAVLDASRVDRAHSSAPRGERGSASPSASMLPSGCCLWFCAAISPTPGT
jgi:3-oxoadipate enol-lactonase